MIAITVWREFTMNDPIQQFLEKRPFMVLDGALATELERRGADLRDPLWSAKCLIDSPAEIRDVHYDYFLAGADVATTATYQATFEAFEGRGLTRCDAAQLMRLAVTLAVAARDDFWASEPAGTTRLRPLIAASIGPYGAMLADGSEYHGHYRLTDAALADFHRPRFDILASSGADLIACETLPCLREALVLARLLAGHPTLSAWISFACQDGSRNCEGEDVGDCVAALLPFPQVAAVGVNCTAPQHIPSLLRHMRQRTSRPLVAYPNSGESYDASSKQWRGEQNVVPFAEQTSRWYTEGARLIGGCCRTGPDDIRRAALSLTAQCAHSF